MTISNELEQQKQYKDGVLVFTIKIARELIRKGYVVIDVFPQKHNTLLTLFKFKEEGNIIEDLEILKNKK